MDNTSVAMTTGSKFTLTSHITVEPMTNTSAPPRGDSSTTGHYTPSWDDIRTREFRPDVTTANVFITLHIVYILLIVVGNTFVLLLVLTRKRLRTPTNFYIASLCVSDLSIGLFVIPAEIAHLFLEDARSQALCKGIQYTVHLALAAYVFCVVCITVDRFFLVILPHRAKFTLKQALLLVAFFWLVAALYAIRAIFLYDVVSMEHLAEDGHLVTDNHCSVPDEEETINKCFILLDLVILYLLPLAAITYMYVRILLKFASQKRRQTSITFAAANQKKRRKATIMFMIIVFSFLVSHLPRHVFFIYVHFVGWFEGFSYVYQVCDLIAFSNAWINVFIYVCFNDNFRSEIKQLRHPGTNHSVVNYRGKVAPVSSVSGNVVSSGVKATTSAPTGELS